MVGDDLQAHQFRLDLELVLHHDYAELHRRRQQLLAFLVLDLLEVPLALLFREDQQGMGPWLVGVNNDAVGLGLDDQQEWFFLDDYSLIFALKIYDLVVDLYQRFLAFPTAHLLAPPDEGIELELLVEDVVRTVEVGRLGDLTDHVFSVVEARSMWRVLEAILLYLFELAGQGAEGG